MESNIKGLHTLVDGCTTSDPDMNSARIQTKEKQIDSRVTSGIRTRACRNGIEMPEESPWRRLLRHLDGFITFVIVHQSF